MREGAHQLIHAFGKSGFQLWIGRDAHDRAPVAWLHNLPKEARRRALLEVEAMLDRAGSVEKKNQPKRQLTFAVDPGDVLKRVVFVQREVSKRKIVYLVTRGIGHRRNDRDKFGAKLYRFVILRFVGRGVVLSWRW